MPTTLNAILSAVPERAVAFETREGNLITLLRPKFLSPHLGWLQRLMPRPTFKVKLDDIGTCLWVHMDGQRNGFELAEILRLAFGERVEPAETRTATFLNQLADGGFTRVAGGTPEQTRMGAE